MSSQSNRQLESRRGDGQTKKSHGEIYTPRGLSDFVADKIVQAARSLPTNRPVRILDPAVGHGVLLSSLLDRLARQPDLYVHAMGFDTNGDALRFAKSKMESQFPKFQLAFREENFLEFIDHEFGPDGSQSLFSWANPERFDLIIANPPYVRTQVLGTAQAQRLSKRFDLSGRVDLYHAFILGIANVLQPEGVAGVIVSNRFMTTKSGAAVRRGLLQGFEVQHVWDLGDTKLFDAAVLPSVVLFAGPETAKQGVPKFTSIYETSMTANCYTADPISALNLEGVVEISDGRRFNVRQGQLNNGGAVDGVWRGSNAKIDGWLNTVARHTWATFGDVGKVRVGVKTCADKTFIRTDWARMPSHLQPELLKPLTNHRVARRFRAKTEATPTQILYPHATLDGKRRAVDLRHFPRSRAYLESHRAKLESRQYVLDAGRNWYEIWVPQNPEAWIQPKLVFRDIVDQPTFWIDLNGSIINGDCYWMVCKDPNMEDLLWLAAAVGNSTFIEEFYDRRFSNKLYSGRRRFITQYVKEFPLPDPSSALGRAIIALTKRIYASVTSPTYDQLYSELNRLVWESFGLSVEEVSR